jgi:hypothetical protein
MGQGRPNLTLVHNRMPLLTRKEGTPLLFECSSMMIVEIRADCRVLDGEVMGGQKQFKCFDSLKRF